MRMTSLHSCRVSACIGQATLSGFLHTKSVQTSSICSFKAQACTELLSGIQGEDEAPAHQRKASVYGGTGPPQKSPRLWKFTPARGGNANNTGVLPFEAVSNPPLCSLAAICLSFQAIQSGTACD